MIDELDLARGFVDATLRAEFPELGLVYVEVPVRPRRSPPEVRARMRQASDRFTGAKAVALRQQPIPWAYRVFFRHVGIDPDERRTPIEAIALERMRAGGFHSRNLVDDALLLATLETGVPVLAFDAAAVEGELGLRVSGGGELLGGDGLPVGSGQVVVADSVRALTVLFGEIAPGCAVQRTSERMVLAGVRVKGVPEVSVEEALWVAAETVSGDDRR
jgi:DNA/RNA-binding domain of Phe-tRNA-synthetase-like protein